VEPNPYQPPKETGYAPPVSTQYPKKIDLSVIGFLLAAFAIVGALNIARTGDFVNSAGALMAPSGIVGLLLSLIGFMIRPSRLAAAGMAMGAFVSIYLAGFWLESISN
jgi:hypothetical protein